jgi:hypothetical protein
MPDPTPEPPTFYSNFVSSLMSVDELTMEFRRFFVPHSSFLSQFGEGRVQVPTITPRDIASLEPIARVVLTFAAAKALQSYLNAVLPGFEALRRAASAPVLEKTE